METTTLMILMAAALVVPAVGLFHKNE